MVQIGRFNILSVVKTLDFGIYLDGGKLGEILMPTRYVPEDTEIGDELNAFIYLDSEDRLIATTEFPKAQVGEFALLKVVSVNNYGAFLDWGLMKDLLVPYREQAMTMELGKEYLVYVFLDDETNRIAATAKLDKYLDNIMPEYEEGEEVDLIIANQTDIGYNAIVNSKHWGLLYANEVFSELRKGQVITGYVKKLRDDDKIDLTLYKPGYEKVEGIAGDILNRLKESAGFLPISDKTDAEIIYLKLGISKKNFKKAIGSLFKQKLITIEDSGIRLV